MMNRLPAELYQPAQVAAMDRLAIADHGLPGSLLMQRAALAAWRLLRQRWPGHARVLVLCGSGNNGGDGWLLADLVRSDGVRAEVIHAGDPARLHGDAGQAARRYLDHGGEVLVPELPLPQGPLVVVDALLGTGLDRAVDGALGDLIDRVNAAAQRACWPVLAIDIPSGLHGDTGAVMGTAVRATLTLSYIGLKRGLYTGAGPDCAGEVVWDGLGVPAAVLASQPAAARRVDATLPGRVLRPRPRDAHKGRHGHVLVVGGEHGMGGAALLAAEAALRVGAGLVSLATRPAHLGAALARRPEIMAHAIDGPDDLAPLLARADVVAVGPGLGQADWGRALFERVIDAGLPMVIDADALTLLAARPRRLANALLTPHPGEAGRLLGLDAAAVQADRWAAAGALVERYAATVILKGAGSVVAHREGVPAVCAAGNPGLASGGTGDVLTGVCAGLLAQGFAGSLAAELAVCVHASAADRAAAEGGERGLLAADLMPWLRWAVNPPATADDACDAAVSSAPPAGLSAEETPTDESQPLAWVLADESAMSSFGAALAAAAGPDGLIVHLSGELGAGKTTLARGVLRGLGHQGPVPSPTYTLVEPYECADRRCLHVDLYRLADPSELEYLGLRDEFDPSLLLLVEWPERGRGGLPGADLLIGLDDEGSGRIARVQARSVRGRCCLARLARAWPPG